MERDKHLDSIKFFLVSLVVWGHTFEYNLMQDSTKMFLYSFFSIFVMPLFIMTSGYVSKNVTWSKFIKSAIGLILTYYVFQALYSTVDIVQGKFVWHDFFFKTRGPLWYLLGMVVWKFMAVFIVKYKISFLWSMLVSIAIGLALGMIDTIIPTSRLLVFSPFFIVGLFATKEHLTKIRSINIFYFVGILLVCFVLAIFLSQDKYAIYTVYGEIPYILYKSQLTGMMYRLLFIPLAILCSIAVFRLIPDIFHKLGSQSLIIFLYHPMIVQVYRLLQDKFDLHLSALPELFIAIFIVCLCLLLSRLKVIQLIANPISLFSLFSKKEAKVR